MHRGTLEHHNWLWDSGFHRKMRSVAASRRWGGEPVDQLLLTGLSLGGALAELTALRLISAHPSLAPLVHVVTFGPIPWASISVSEHFASLLRRRSVQLVNMRRLRASPAEKPSWWVLDWSFSSWRRGESEFVVCDPLASARVHLPRARPDFFVLPNVIACSAQAATIDPRATELLAQSRVGWTALRLLMTGELSSDEPLALDYEALHTGKAYRATLIAMLVRHRASKEKASLVPRQAPDEETLGLFSRVVKQLSGDQHGCQLPNCCMYTHSFRLQI